MRSLGAYEHSIRPPNVIVSFSMGFFSLLGTLQFYDSILTSVLNTLQKLLWNFRKL